MRLDPSVKMKQEASTDDVAELQEQLAQCTLKKKQPLIKSEVEEDDEPEVKTLTSALNDLSVEPAAEAQLEERIERGRMNTPSQVCRTAPYSKQNHLSGGKLIERTTTTSPSSSVDSFVIAPINPCLVQKPPIVDEGIFDCSNQLYPEDIFLDIAAFIQQMPEIVQNEIDNHGGPPIVSSPSITICSPVQPSPSSSGYESGSSSPSPSPPRSEETLIPETIQAVNSIHRPTVRPIIPKTQLNLSFERKFYEYILGYGAYTDMNNQIFTRTKNIVYNLNHLETFTRTVNDGDTILLVALANKNALNNLVAKNNYSEDHKEVYRLSFIFNLVERLGSELPKALEVKNMQKQSVLHIAASNCHQHPLVAAFIAEKLEQNNENIFIEVCTAEHCISNGSGLLSEKTLLHCIAQLGDSHAEVLRNLLQLASVKKLIETPCRLLEESTIKMLTPLHVAIWVHTREGTIATESVKILLQNGARVGRSQAQMINSALHFALSGTPSYELVDLILQEKSSTEANVVDLKGDHPLMILASNCNKVSEREFLRILNLLSSRGSSIKRVTSEPQVFFDLLYKNLSPKTALEARGKLIS